MRADTSHSCGGLLPYTCIRRNNGSPAKKEFYVINSLRDDQIIRGTLEAGCRSVTKFHIRGRGLGKVPSLSAVQKIGETLGWKIGLSKCHQLTHRGKWLEKVFRVFF